MQIFESFIGKSRINSASFTIPKPSSQQKSTKSRSRALRRLEPYNRSPADGNDRQHGSRHSSGKRPHRLKGSRSRLKTNSRSRSPAEPPQWAKDLLKNQEENVKELKRLQSEIERSRTATASKPVARVPEAIV